MIHTDIIAEMQPFCVRVDESCGYKAKYCLPFEYEYGSSARIGIIAPMFLPQLHLMEHKYNAQHVRYVCHDKMKHDYVDTQLFFCPPGEVLGTETNQL